MPNHKNIQKILLAVDGSEHSHAATIFVRNLPFSASPEIHSVAVLPNFQDFQRPVLETALKQTRHLLEERNLNVDTRLLRGHPASEIIEYANQLNPTLIVMGAKGLRSTLGILLGGVAQQVVEHANWPVLIVRFPVDKVQRILFVTDGSIYSQRAAEFLTEFPPPTDVLVHVLHVLPPPPVAEIFAKSGYYGVSTINNPPIVQDIEETFAYQMKEEEDQGKKILDDAIRMMRSSEFRINKVLLRGDAATEIMDYIKEKDIDLIIAGSRGLGQVRGWLLGSVSRKLVHYTDCSVLIVKSPQKNGAL